MKNWLFYRVLPKFLYILINLLSITCKIKHIGNKRVNLLVKQKQSILYVFWHGRILLLMRSFSKKNISIMVSTSRDGLLITNVLQLFGYKIARGSSHRSPMRAVIESLQWIKRGYAMAITVDGPTGPIYKAKAGALIIAKKSNAYIVPISFSANPAFEINSWDRMMIPAPFARSVLYYGKPFKPSSSFDEKIIQREIQDLEDRLNINTKSADSLVRLNSYHSHYSRVDNSCI